MKTTYLSLIAAACVAASSHAWTAEADEHAGHHPTAASAASAPVKAKTAKAATAPKHSGPAKTSEPSAIDQQMQAMQAMHDKMMSAKTPEERRGLLDDQMKTMESGMAMMEQMGMGSQTPAPAAWGASASSGMGRGSGMGGGMGMGAGDMHSQHQLMMKRMEMMQMMMRMMMDRLSAEPTK